LQSFSPVNTTNYNYTDNNLSIGANTYKVVLLLTNGRSIESKVQTIIQPNTNGWWVFPNPVKRGGQLKIINRRDETEAFYLDILDMNGRKVKSMLVPLIDNSISVANLSAGMYIMVFTDGKKQIGIQKLLIQP
jgi:predicted RNA-binding protein associated with RNAse of E/G family